MYVSNWYTIPGFTSYEINIHDSSIRSLKHYKKDCFHIMKVYDDGNVRIVDDTGRPTRISPEELYKLTFNSGNKLIPREDNAVYKSGMVKGMRKMKSNVDVINGTVKNLPIKPKVFYEYDFYENYSIEGNDNQESVIPDFMKLFQNDMIKPFVINPKNEQN